MKEHTHENQYCTENGMLGLGEMVEWHNNN